MVVFHGGKRGAVSAWAVVYKVSAHGGQGEGEEAGVACSVDGAGKDGISDKIDESEWHVVGRAKDDGRVLGVIPPHVRDIAFHVIDGAIPILLKGRSLAL